jgi:pSer/pThr/pTyr-binding forkhead associated (FHA) protein
MNGSLGGKAMAYIVRKKLDGSAAERWEIKDKPVSFGRGEEADVQIKDERMSRQHFIIEPREEKFFARDLNSTNGTFVNNVPITEVELQSNDRIRGGQTVVVFEMEKPKPVANVINQMSSEPRGNKPYLGAVAKETKPR